MHTTDLTGAWQLTRAGEADRIPARVPGCVHADLLSAGVIEDPFYRDNEDDVQWIGEADWVYSRRFTAPPELMRCEKVLLRCLGLDTLAAVRINGKLLGRTDNMFRTWEFDAKPAIRAGENTIDVRFDSTLPYIRKLSKTRHLPMWGLDHAVPGGNWVRKEPCNYGWDWGPKLVTCGIWRDLGLVGFSTARLTDVRVLQDHSARSASVALDVQLGLERLTRRPLTAEVSVTLRGRIVTRAEVPVRGRRADARVVIDNARLWWPNGMGDQPLYDVTVDLLDESGGLVDTVSRRVGLRTLRLERKKDRWGESFQFVANGVPFFAKGANWIPADAILARMTRDRYGDLLGSAAAANMNMLRVWGGGIYEDDTFYDLCDELGICIWQDFLFACATYPTFDADFLANVRAEAEDNVRRLRHHPCLALWCGNNELEQGLVGPEWNDHQMSWADYKKLFDRLLPAVVGKLDPQRDYWPGSPHSPRGDRGDHRNPTCGDAHLWDVWHGRKPFEWYRTTTHRFCSEFGFQSFPQPRTVAAFTRPADRNVTSHVMEHHQRSGIGNTAIVTYMLDWFRMPRNFEMTLWLSQILQGLAMKYAVEHWRRAMPRSMGTLYWQLNDCWPAASWSSIDYHGRWKALHHLARQFYAPLLVTAVEDAHTGKVQVHVTSDLLKPVSTKLTWRLTTPSGNLLADGTQSVRIPPRKSFSAATLDFSAHLARHGPRELMLFLDLAHRGRSVSTNFASFARPKHIDLQQPEITTKVRSAQRGPTTITLKSKRPALWVWLELSGIDARFSDNFFHLPVGQSVEVLAWGATRNGTPVLPQAFAQKLRVRSLVDTY